MATMSNDCKAVLGEFFCSTYFKPCHVVPSDTPGVMQEVFPRQLCKDTCLRVKELGCESMLVDFGLRSVNCDGRVAMEDFGMLESNLYEGVEASLALLHDTEMFPEGAYSISSGTGEIVDTECFTYDLVKDELLQSRLSDIIDECPGSLVRNTGGTGALCLEPCPSFIFTREEYGTMALMFVLPGLFAFFVNLYLIMTVVVARYSRTVIRQKHDVHMPFGTKLSAFVCCMWAVMDIFPALLLDTRVGCSCDSMACYQDSAACSVSKASVFVLQLVFMGNFLTCLELDIKIHDPLGCKYAIAKMWRWAPMFLSVPLLLFVAAVTLETDDVDAPNYYLNQHRSNFKCFYNLNDMGQEFVINYLVFMFCALSSGVLVGRSVIRVFAMTDATAVPSSRSSNTSRNRVKMFQSFAKKFWRMLALATTSMMLLVAYITMAIQMGPLVENFGVTAEQWTLCMNTQLVLGELNKMQVESGLLYDTYVHVSVYIHMCVCVADTHTFTCVCVCVCVCVFICICIYNP
jgi:hypothetical protein